MSETLFDTMIKVENKEIFVDIKRNKNGVYLKISERNDGVRNTVLIPASGIEKLKEVLDLASKSVTDNKPLLSARKALKAADAEITRRSVYVTSLPWETTDEELAEFFRQAGDVVSATIMRQHRRPAGRTSMGCGVVQFTTPDDALRAIAVLNDTVLGGRTIKVREDRSPSADADTPAVTPTEQARESRIPLSARSQQDRAIDPLKVFASNLSWNTSEEDLIKLFSTVGPVTSAEVLITKTGRAMGAGVVTYANSESVEAAIKVLAGLEFMGRSIAVRHCYL